MVEKKTIFSSTVSYGGIFSFKDFYIFCYDWIKDEISPNSFSEGKYEEKIKGDTKEIVVEWSGSKDLSDYFRFDMKIVLEVSPLKNIEVQKGGIKLKTNDGKIKIKIKGILVKDPKGKFEMSAFKKFLRGIYEKWVIPSEISAHEDKIASMCDEFLGQAKAWLDLEAKR